MKPTDLQKKVIDLCRGQLSFWSSTNDINSPTHYSDLDSDFDNFCFDNNLSEEELSKVKDSLLNLFLSIKKLSQ